MKELGRWLTYEATREWLPTQDLVIETPLAPISATFIDPQLPWAVVPILRAGLTLVEGIQEVIPNAATYHYGLVRDEETLQPTCYLNKLPPTFAPETRIVISEPMLATGGSILHLLDDLVQRQVDPAFIRIIAIVAAPPALQKIGTQYPDLQIYTATIDEQVNDRGFIVPGLGDAGDRAFGTQD